MRSRRVNYAYLRRLVERLEDLDHSVNELPDEILRAPWHTIREYIERHLRLQYCVRCKLPIPNNWRDPTFSNLCLMHAAGLRDAARKRLRPAVTPATILYGDEPPDTPRERFEPENILNKARGTK